MKTFFSLIAFALFVAAGVWFWTTQISPGGDRAAAAQATTSSSGSATVTAAALAPTPIVATEVNLAAMFPQTVVQQTDASGAQAQQQAPQMDVTKITGATLHTTKGDITIEFYKSETPNTVLNFIKLAGTGFYDGTKFHRVIKEFMIQGGDPFSRDDSRAVQWGMGGPGYAFADEIGPTNRNDAGTVAMANSGPDTNGSQFFINVNNNNHLDTKHTVFGKVTAGVDVVKQIENTPTGANDRPTESMVITRVTLR